MIRSMMGRKKGGMEIEGAPNGVYILRTDNRLYTEKMWKKEWNSDAVGVAFISNACRFVIAPTESETELWWNVDAPTIPGVITTNDWDTARIDYAGVANSTAMIKALGRERSHAAGWCNQYLFKNGKNGYLGACGEWDYVDGYLTDIGLRLQGRINKLVTLSLGCHRRKTANVYSEKIIDNRQPQVGYFLLKQMEI